MKRKYLALGVGAAALLAGGLTSPWHAAAQGTIRYVSPHGVDSGDCSVSTSPCATITYAVNQAAAGDTVQLARGAYNEQVTITKDLTLKGAGSSHSTIFAPAALTDDAQGQASILTITNDGVPTDPIPTVTVENLTVSGPGPDGGGNSCGSSSTSLDRGISVYGGATLKLTNAAVWNILNRPTSGCQTGNAINVGTECATCAADTGTAILNNDTVALFQKTGILLAGSASKLVAKNTEVLNEPSTAIASNGIELDDGALAQLTNVTVSGNQCNLSSACGSNLASQTQSFGVLVVDVASGSYIKNSSINQNDAGLYADSPVNVTNTNIDNNRYVGVYVDTGASEAHFNTVSASSTGTTVAEYGFYVLSPSFNQFVSDTATGNTNNESGSVTPYDMYAHVTGHDNNLYSANTCNTASPSLNYWNCA